MWKRGFFNTIYRGGGAGVEDFGVGVRRILYVLGVDLSKKVM